MTICSRFSVAVHILTLLESTRGEPARSEWIAGSVNTNPAVVRRILSMLARAGLTRSRFGVGGGALLAKPASEITLLDVYRAVDDAQLFTLHERANPKCSVGRNIQRVLEGTTQAAQAALERELARKTVCDVLHEVRDQERRTAAIGAA